LKTLILIVALVAVSTNAQSTEPDFQKLIETANAGIMIGLEGAGKSRLVSNCVFALYLTTDQARVDAVLPGSKAQDVPKNLQEYRWALERAQKNLAKWILRCEGLTK